MATLAEVRSRAFQRADMEYATAVNDVDRLVTNDECDALINLGYKELVGHLVRAGMHRTESVLSLTATGATAYDLPTSLWAVLTVHRLDNEDAPLMLSRHDHRVRPSSSFQAAAQSYRVVGRRIEFNPQPADGTYEIRYVAVPELLVADDDDLDAILGWEEYVVLFAATKMLQKEGSHRTAAALQGDMRELMARIQDEAQAAELSEGSVVQNVRTGTGYDLPGGFVGWYRPTWLL